MHWPNCHRCGAIVTNEYHKCGDIVADNKREQTLEEKLQLIDRTTRRQVERIIDKHLKSRGLM